MADKPLFMRGLPTQTKIKLMRFVLYRKLARGISD